MKKRFGRLTALFLCLVLGLTVLLPQGDMIANAAGNITINVSFRNDSANYGKVQYSLDDGASWNDITQNDSREVTVTGTQLRIKVVPNEGYQVDFSGCPPAATPLSAYCSRQPTGRYA